MVISEGNCPNSLGRRRIWQENFGIQRGCDTLGYWDFTDIPTDERDALLEKGKGRLGWAHSHMVVLDQLGSEIKQRGHLNGKKISMALHTEAKTGILALTLARCGAQVRLASCNPLSTDDPIALALQYEDTSPGSLEGCIDDL